MRTFLCLWAFLFSASFTWANGNLQKAVVDFETMEYLFQKAVRLSNITRFSLDVVPTVFLVTKDQMNAEVCPEKPGQCRNLAAVFDDVNYRILLLEDLKITENFKPFEYSFLIHELVHVLQYRLAGAEIFRDCQAIFQTEELAYRVQDQYLKEEGEFFRPSVALKSFYCDEQEAGADYKKSLEVWKARKRLGWAL